MCGELLIFDTNQQFATHKLQRGLRPDGMDLAQVSAASKHMQRSADVEGGRVLLGGLGAWRGQRGGGWRLLGGEHIEQRLDLGVAFGDLLEVELVSREVLPQREQLFLAIVAGERSDQLLARSMATAVAMDR